MSRHLVLPLILGLAGFVAGAGAGQLLRPATTAPVEDGSGDAAPDPVASETVATEFVTFDTQFIIPVLKEGRVVSLVVLSLGLEIVEGERKLVFAREPRIRDSFLQLLFDHANAGGFEGAFTDGTRLATLRKALLETAHAILGSAVRDVLVVEIARQDG